MPHVATEDGTRLYHEETDEEDKPCLAPALLMQER